MEGEDEGQQCEDCEACMESKTRNELGGGVEHMNTSKTWYSPQDSEGCLLNKVGM